MNRIHKSRLEKIKNLYISIKKKSRPEKNQEKKERIEIDPSVYQNKQGCLSLILFFLLYFLTIQKKLKEKRDLKMWCMGYSWWFRILFDGASLFQDWEAQHCSRRNQGHQRNSSLFLLLWIWKFHCTASS